MSRLKNDYPDDRSEREKCRNFLSSSTQHALQLQDIANRQSTVLSISIDDILFLENDIQFVDNIRDNSLRYIEYFESVAETLLPASNHTFEEDVFDILERQRHDEFSGVGLDDPTSLKIRRYEVQLIPQSSEPLRTLRELNANCIGSLMKLKGLVVRATDIKPCIKLATYNCEVCGSEIFQPVNGVRFMPLPKCPSQRCTDNKTNGKLAMINRGSVFTKYQELKLQELPDQVPVGHIPRSVTIHCWGEQTRQCMPGDVITVSGIFLSMKSGGYQGMVTGLLSETYIKAMKIEKNIAGNDRVNTHTEIQAMIQEMIHSPDTYSKLAQSIAPEIFGHEDVKKALLLQLVGAETRVMSDGMKIRGDINICLMGDPGVAKSQLLKYIARISPRGVYTTGKGSSGVGLTASVVRDEVSGEMALEGGALVLADCGICCIDEFDKMDDNDRTAIHEVMEQQTISIAKAGITTTLNARAAVLAAANPLYGRYNKKKSVSENVDLPNSLLSRFDLLFLILDTVNNEQDMALSRHVLHVHKYMEKSEQTRKIYPQAVIVEYLEMAGKIKPTFPPDLTTYIVEAYVSLRSQKLDTRRSYDNKAGDQTAITARQLLSILRLSQSLAKLRLSSEISIEDVDEAIRLVHASKASITGSDTEQQEDPLSAVFNTIKSIFDRNQVKSVPYTLIETTIVKKGYTVKQLEACLQDYEELGILIFNGDIVELN